MEVITYDEIIGKYNPGDNISMPIVTKYELAKILGLRMEQLYRNAPTLIDVSKLDLSNLVNHEKFLKIASEEIKKRVIPYMVVRNLPNGKKEYFKLADMVVPGY
jgi:DNA-directed RNA polymerase subunit K